MKVRFVTTLDEALIQEIKIRAVKENRYVNEILEELIEGYLKKKTIKMGDENEKNL